MGMSAISIKGLNKSFEPGKMALSDVDLAIRPGEMVALIGASGSGKSTLMRHVAGLVAGDRRRGEGRIDVLGRTVQRNGRIARDIRRIRSEIGFVFQQFNLVGRLSVLTNVCAGSLGRVPGWRGTLGMFPEADQYAAMMALDRVGIADKAMQRASTLSGGQQQRAAIARTLVQRAKIVLADEPVASLDPASSARVMETLTDINSRDGITVLVSLHQVDLATRYCRRAVAMQAGRVVFDGPTEALTPAVLADLFGADADDGETTIPLPMPRKGAREPEPALAFA